VSTRASDPHKQCETQFTRDWTVRRLEWSARFIIIIIIILRQVFAHTTVRSVRIYIYILYALRALRLSSRLRSHAVIVGVSRVPIPQHTTAAVAARLLLRRPLREVAKNNRRWPFRPAEYRIYAVYLTLTYDIYVPISSCTARVYLRTWCPIGTQQHARLVVNYE